jgi:lipoprotein signal peptidase
MRSRDEARGAGRARAARAGLRGAGPAGSVLSFPGKGAVLAGLAALGLAAVIALWWRRRGAPLSEQAAYSLIVAGAIGNVLDRAFRGYVIDFIEIRRWPVFNVADAAILAGGILLAIVTFRRQDRDQDVRPAPGG